MNLLKTAMLGLAVTATTLAALPSAQAGDGWNRYNYGRYNNYGHYNRYNSGDLVAAGVLGLAVGALAAGIAATSRPGYSYYDRVPVYDAPAYRGPVYEGPVYREGPVRGYYRAAARGLEPWSPQWYDYCESRYRSFNPRTGTYTGYDGLRHFCAAY